jgi:hypothetical protein
MLYYYYRVKILSIFSNLPIADLPSLAPDKKKICWILTLIGYSLIDKLWDRRQ